MQTWSQTTNIIRRGKYTFTKDMVFAIEPIAEIDKEPEIQTTSDKLYILHDYPIEMSALSTLINDGIITKEKTPINLGTKKIPKMYDVYKFYKLLSDHRVYDANGEPDYDDDTSINENDCLKFGECLTIASQSRNKTLFEELLRANKNPPLLQTSITGKTFAETEEDKANIKLVKEIGLSKKNNFAIPKSGESYAIVRKKVAENTAYHAAFVLYTHNGVNITLEAEADAGSTYQPKFCFYDIDPVGNTFHRRWSAELYKKSADPDHQQRYNALFNNGETIVLKSRNMNDIMRELEMEKRKLSASDRLGTAPSAKKKRIGGKKSKSTFKSESRKINKKRFNRTNRNRSNKRLKKTNKMK
jgi:hypothetical protein